MVPLAMIGTLPMGPPRGGTDVPTARPIASGRTELLVAATFLDADTGFAVGGVKESGTPAMLLRTDDGAGRWTAIDTGVQSRLYRIQFPTDRVGYAVGLHGAVLKTEDRGRTWTTKPPPGDVWLASVFFTSAAVGYAVGGCASASGGPDAAAGAAGWKCGS